MGTLLHLAELTDWRDAQVTGTYRRSTRGAWVENVGFVHASTAAQIGPVADAFYADLPVDQLVLLVIDEDLLTRAGLPVRWELVGDEPYPHIVGAVPVGAVVATRPVERQGGHLVPPDLDGLDVVPGPPV